MDLLHDALVGADKVGLEDGVHVGEMDVPPGDDITRHIWVWHSGDHEMEQGRAGIGVRRGRAGIR
jgi:hypothetical protein